MFTKKPMKDVKTLKKHQIKDKTFLWRTMYVQMCVCVKSST